VLNLPSDDCFTAGENAIRAFAEEGDPVFGIDECQIKRQSREHGSQLFDADMAGRHHDCSIFGHSASGRSVGRRGKVPLLWLDQAPTILGRRGPYLSPLVLGEGLLRHWKEDVLTTESGSDTFAVPGA